MSTPPLLRFIERPFPSANMVLALGPRPLLIDTGYGADIQETERLVRAAGVAAGDLTLIANTHYHSDHVGGNARLQERYGVPVAAHAWDAGLINRRDPEVGAARWLEQPIEPYQVQRALHDGDELETGAGALRVIHTPGHTLGQLAFYDAASQTLVCGDAVHRDDVGWLNPFREGAAALERAIESLERLTRLPVRVAYSGHGPAITDFATSAQRALGRYAAWIERPDKLAWHACKRIFAYALMITDGMEAEALDAYLRRCGWLQDYCQSYLRLSLDIGAQRVLEEAVRSGAAVWQGKRLCAAAPYIAPFAGWLTRPGLPADWPRTL